MELGKPRPIYVAKRALSVEGRDHLKECGESEAVYYQEEKVAFGRCPKCGTGRMALLFGRSQS